MTQDMTLDEIRDLLAPVLARHAAFDGWRKEAVIMAAAEKGGDADIAALAFADGPVDMIDAWFASIDAAMLDALPPETLDALSIRKKIIALVEARLALVAPDREALRRALAIMAMPRNAPRALKTGWNSADVMWRLAGDTATDYNHYTKRAILASIYGAPLAVFVDDESEGKAETRAFLERRIDGGMTFERVKSKWLNPDRESFSVSRFLGRLRYPAR